MTYFCFIESSVTSVPHMEPLVSTNRKDAVSEAVDLMRLHLSAVSVHIFLDGERVETVLAADASALRSLAEARQNAAI